MKTPVRSNILFECAFLFLGIIFLVETIGNNIYTNSQDLENHLLIAKYINEARSVNVIPFPLLSEYPALSHWIVVLVSPLFGSILAAFTKTSVITVMLIYYSIFRFMQQYSNLHVVLCFAFLSIFVLLGIDIHGNEVVKNFFFPQLISSWLALLIAYLITIEKCFKNRIQFLFYFLLMIAIGYCVHPTTILIVGAAYLLKLLIDIISNGKICYSDFYIFAFSSLSIIIITVIIPYNRTMSKIALNNGHLPIGFLATPYSILPSGVIFLIMCLIFSILCLRSYIYKNSNERMLESNTTIASVLASGSFIAICHLILAIYGKSTYYASKKNIFIITTFLCILLSITTSDFIINKFKLTKFKKTLYYKKSPSLAIILSISVLFIIFWNKELMPIAILQNIGNECVKLQDKIGLSARQRTIVQLPVDSVSNYILSSCYIDFPNRDVLCKVLRDTITEELKSTNSLGSTVSCISNYSYKYIITSKEALFPVKNNTGKIFNYNNLQILSTQDYKKEYIDPYPINQGDVVKTNNKLINRRIFLNGISSAEDWGSWSDGTHTKIQLHVENPKDNNILQILVQPFINGARDRFNASYILNNNKHDLGFFSSNNLPTSIINIPFKFSDLDINKNITLDFYYTDLMPCFKSSGLRKGDPRELSFGFITISLKQ